ncbi:MAG: hypothetical protein KAI84_10725, partial [Gammaproteobacteria bacterium]|nr:hypothetical protein [Gammaproteobacteria bacterium]
MKINYSLPDFSYNKRNMKIILIVIALYLFFLITTLPATVALAAINLPKNITLSSISGTIWSGNARQFHVSGVALGSVNWE